MQRVFQTCNLVACISQHLVLHEVIALGNVNKCLSNSAHSESVWARLGFHSLGLPAAEEDEDWQLVEDTKRTMTQAFHDDFRADLLLAGPVPQVQGVPELVLGVAYFPAELQTKLPVSSWLPEPSSTFGCKFARRLVGVRVLSATANSKASEPSAWHGRLLVCTEATLADVHAHLMQAAREYGSMPACAVALVGDAKDAEVDATPLLAGLRCLLWKVAETHTVHDFELVHPVPCSCEQPSVQRTLLRASRFALTAPLFATAHAALTVPLFASVPLVVTSVTGTVAGAGGAGWCCGFTWKLEEKTWKLNAVATGAAAGGLMGVAVGSLLSVPSACYGVIVSIGDGIRSGLRLARADGDEQLTLSSMCSDAFLHTHTRRYCQDKAPSLSTLCLP